MEYKFQRLNREFFTAHPKVVALKLLGKYLIREISHKKIITKIIETEAYGGKEDKACHIGRFGKTKRTELLFNTPGLTYIYSVHINMYCLNIVSHIENEAGGVLIRSLEPLEGINLILTNLKLTDKKYRIEKLLNGPAKLCKSLKIDKSLNAEDIIKSNKIYITQGEVIDKKVIATTPRINIPYAGKSREWLWRFIIKDSKFLSR